MYYYKVWIDDSDPSAIVCVDRVDRGFDEYRFYDGRWIEDWPDGVMFYVEGAQTEHYLVGGLHWLLVSGRVRETLEDCKVEGVQFLPVQILDRATSKEIGPYWALNVVRIIAALDWERTRWFSLEKRDRSEHPILNIVREALLAEPLKGVDIFHLKVKDDVGGVYVSARVCACLQRAGVTSGFEFIPVPAH